MPDPLRDDQHDEHCACTDLTFSLSDPVARPRAAGHEAGIPPLLGAAAPFDAVRAMHERPPARWTGADEPGGGQRLAALRSTRLLI